jgi:hypothetical protein
MIKGYMPRLRIEIINLEYKEAYGGIFSALIYHFDRICRHKQTIKTNILVNISIAFLK